MSATFSTTDYPALFVCEGHCRQEKRVQCFTTKNGTNRRYRECRKCARARRRARRLPDVTVTAVVTFAAEDLAMGWFGDLDELALSIEAALYEVQGDDGDAYRPTSYTFTHDDTEGR